jgi:hypothetical protein
MLKHENWIGFDITHVHFLSKSLNVSVLLAHQPAYVRKEESPSGIVRIGIRVCEFVVSSMIARPLVNAILKGGRLKVQKE